MTSWVEPSALGFFRWRPCFFVWQKPFAQCCSSSSESWQAIFLCSFGCRSIGLSIEGLAAALRTRGSSLVVSGLGCSFGKKVGTKGVTRVLGLTALQVNVDRRL